VTISVQDLVDTLRTLEAQILSLDDPSPLDATGKDVIGVDKNVGITLTLQNARVAFEARPPPNYVQCIIDGGNLLAVDDLGNVMSPIHPTAFTQVVIEQSTSPTLVYSSGGSPEDIADAVWNETSAGHIGGGKAGDQIWTKVDGMVSVTGDIYDEVEFLRRFFTNKKAWDDVNKRWDIYDDVGAVVLYHWKPRTKTGAEVTMPADAFATSDKVAP
jgi:hypothetical protein